MKHSVFIIAEIGSIYDGSFGNALKAIELAKTVGADAVKFQTHLAEYETVKNAPMPSYFKGEARYDYFRRTAFSFDQWKALKNHCNDLRIEFISSPFSTEAVSLLEDVGICCYKIASGEVTNVDMLAAIAKTGKPVILSSGMSNWSELDLAVSVLREYGCVDLSVLQCSSAYPCPLSQVGLNVIHEIKTRYRCKVGFSDHTETNYAAFAAVALGAEIIEKHLTFSKYMYGSDAPLAAEPSQFFDLVSGVRAVLDIMSHPVDKDQLKPYHEMKQVFEKSIVASVTLKKGDTLQKYMIALKKPGGGLPASEISTIIGRQLVRDLGADDPIHLEDLE